MDKEFESGDKIEYRLFDKDGKEYWMKGIIHGVRRYENPKTNMVTRVSYLVDTGRNERLDHFPFNHRDREINSRVNGLLADETNNIDTVDKALKEVAKHTDLPKSKKDVEVIRQPEQIELPPMHIRIPLK